MTTSRWSRSVSALLWIWLAFASAGYPARAACPMHIGMSMGQMDRDRAHRDTHHMPMSPHHDTDQSSDGCTCPWCPMVLGHAIPGMRVLPTGVRAPEAELPTWRWVAIVAESHRLPFAIGPPRG